MPEQVGHGLRLLVHQRLLVGGIAADADADQRDLDVVAEEARRHAAMRARAARADDDGIERQPHVEPLLLHLLHAGDVAQAADRVRAAARDDVALAAVRGEFLGDLRHGGAHVRAARHHGDGLDAHQLEHEVVAAGFLPVAVGHALLDHEAALQPFLDRGGERDAAMVGLRRAAGDQRVGALRQRVGRQELELAGLVAAGEQAQQVVALDPDLRADAARAARRQCLGEMRQQLDRRGSMGVAATRKTGQIHSINSSKKLQLNATEGSARDR